jgi:hypothetical protein
VAAAGSSSDARSTLPPYHRRIPQVWMIHPTAWNRNSRNFAFTEFSEVHLNGTV